MSDKKKLSFDEIQKNFLSLETKDEPVIGARKVEALDSSHFNFDSSNPEAILIAGSSAADSASGCKSCTTTGTSGGGGAASASACTGAGSCSSAADSAAGSGSSGDTGSGDGH